MENQYVPLLCLIYTFSLVLPTALQIPRSIFYDPDTSASAYIAAQIIS